MTLTNLLDLLNVFFAGMLAGSEFIIHYGVHNPAAQLDTHSALVFRKALVLRLRVLIPALFAPTAVLGIGLTVSNSSAPGFVLRCTGVAALFVWIAIRVVGTVPINSATVDWPLDAPPADWQAQVKRAERFHIVGVWAGVLSFACFLLAAALKLAAR